MSEHGHYGESMALSHRRQKGKSLIGHGEQQRTAADTMGAKARPKSGADRFNERFGNLGAFTRTN